MRAVIYDEFKGNIELRDVPVPEVPADGALIEVRATGMCRSDWWGWQGHDQGIRLPHVPGHEFAGVVAKVGGSVRNWKKGDRITAPFVCGCGECGYCLQGEHQVCVRQTQPGFTHWGSFAEYVVVRNADINLVELPDSIDFITAASLGCRFATAYRALHDQAGLMEGQSLVVMGCGGVGLSAIMIATAIGAEVIAVDINEEKLRFAEKLGAAHVINSEEEEYAPEAIQILLDGGAHVTIDALGNSDLINLGIRSLRRQGTHVQVGLTEGTVSNIEVNALAGQELKIHGSHGMSAKDYPRLFELIMSGACNPRELVTGIMSLEQSPRVLMRFGEAPPLGIGVIDMGM